jgi:hypothetical protein
MRVVLVLLSTVLALPALAQDPDVREESPIVVTGTPIAETKARLEACLARKCAPKEDINASLAHAENQFIVGDYVGARDTLDDARGRNNRYAKTLPVEVADLNRADGRLANVDGRPAHSRISQIAALEALKAGLDDSDSRLLIQRLMVGDEFARVGRLIAAEDVYRKVEKQARKAGNLRVAGHAMLRDATIHGALASAWKQYRPLAEHKIGRIERSREPELAEFRNAAKLLRASIAAMGHDTAALEKALAAIPPQPSDNPLLIYAPAIEMKKIASESSKRGLGNDAEWIDLRFEIRADGTVAELDTLRDSGTVGGNWPALVKQAVAQRRYAPIALPPGSDGVSRVERFSFVHDLVLEFGSRIPVRRGRGRITTLDITESPSGSLAASNPGAAAADVPEAPPSTPIFPTRP